MRERPREIRFQGFSLLPWNIVVIPAAVIATYVLAVIGDY